jgi:hypothetical protein
VTLQKVIDKCGKDVNCSCALNTLHLDRDWPITIYFPVRKGGLPDREADDPAELETFQQSRNASEDITLVIIKVTG